MFRIIESNLSWRRSARTHHSAACSSGGRGMVGARSTAAPPLPGRAAMEIATTALPGPAPLASTRAVTAPVPNTEQRSCGAAEPAHPKPPISWASKVIGSMEAAGPAAAVAAVAVPGAAAMSYARAVSPVAAADASAVQGDAAARAACRGVNERGDSLSPQYGRPSRGASPEGCQRPEQQVCLCFIFASPLLCWHQ